jgi:dynein heavy chain
MRSVGPSFNTLTARFLRHFNLITVEAFNDEEMRTIYQPIVESHFIRSDFPEEYFKYAEAYFSFICL